MTQQKLDAFIGDSSELAISLEWAGAAFEPADEWALILTAKDSADDLDVDAVFQKASGAGIEVTGSTATISLVPDDTVDLAEGVRLFDIQAQNIATEKIRTVAIGEIYIQRDITRGTTTSVDVITTEDPLPFGPLIPAQTGNSGKFLTTNGTALSWSVVSSNLTSGPVTSSGGVSAIADGALSIAKTSGLSTELSNLATALTNRVEIDGITAGANISITGSGVVAAPYVVGITGLGTAATAASTDFQSTMKGVVVTKANGTRTAYPPSADTDTARGLALESAFAAAVAGDTIDLSPGNYYVAKSTSTVAAIVTQYSILNGMTIRLNGARLYKQSADTASCMFSMAVTNTSLGPNDWSIIGPGTIEGSTEKSSGAAAEIGVNVWSCRRWRIENVTFKNFRGTALQLNSANFTGDATGYTNGSKYSTGQVVSCRFDLNNLGLGAYSANEATTFTACSFNDNLTGIDLYSGNTRFVGCEAVYNTNYAMRIRNGGNDGHGAWIGGMMNHNAGFSVAAEASMDLGFTFAGSHFFADSGTTNKIQSLGGGLNFTGCIIDSPIYASGTPTGINTVANSFISGTYGNLTDLSAAERLKWVFSENHTLTGPWAENDAQIYIYADNAAAVTGGLTAGRKYRTSTGEVRIVIP